MPEKLSQGPRIGYDASRVGAGLSRGPNKKKTMVAAPWSQTWPAPGATLDLDFANDRGYVRGVGQGKSMDAVTFTRASNATYVNEQGLLVTHANQGALGNNLLTFPQNFENAAWSKLVSIVRADVEIAPDKTLTADVLIANSTGGVGLTQGSFTGTHTSFIYAKLNTARWVRLFRGASSTNGVWFDLQDGVVGTINGSATASIEDAGNGWYRCIVNWPSLSSLNFGIGISSSDNSTTISLEDSLYIWGAQLELGSTATEYFPTNINQPRFDWASTAVVANKNLLRFTDLLTSSAWAKNVGIASTTATTTTLPDATTGTAFTISFSATSGTISQTISALTGDGTASVWIKTVSGDADQIRLNAVNVSGPTQNISGDWTRISLTLAGADRLLLSSKTSSITGDILVYGPQLEIGDTVTDYQPIAQPTTNTPLTANPTSNGLLIEESRTNRLLWNRDATQTQWVKTDVTAAKDQTGIDGVANAASSLTATADGGTCIQTITLASGSRTGSVYLKRITGTGTVQVSLDGSTYSTVDLSSTEWRRIVLSGTVTNPTVGIKIATNGDAVAMDYAQVEDGAFATTPILTTTATVVRSADSASVEGSNFLSFYDQAEETFFIDTKLLEGQPSSTTRGVLGITDSETVNARRKTILYNTFATIGSLNNLQFIFPSAGFDTNSNKFAIRFSRSSMAQCKNSEIVSEAFGNTQTSQGASSLNFGAQSLAGTAIIGYSKTIKKLAFYPKALIDIQMQEITK
jgi:hypothetical protein